MKLVVNNSGKKVKRDPNEPFHRCAFCGSVATRLSPSLKIENGLAQFQILCAHCGRLDLPIMTVEELKYILGIRGG